MSKAEDVGKAFAPKVECWTGYKDGVWFGTISIGEEYYYETDKNSVKRHVIEEMIGCLEGVRDNIDKELVELIKEAL